MKTIERGYFKLEFDEGAKWMHFSMTFLNQLKEIAGEDIMELIEKLNELENQPVGDIYAIVTCLCYAGLRAYDLEEDNEIDYNEYKVANWLTEATKKDPDTGPKIKEALQYIFPDPVKEKVKGKRKGKKKS